MPYAMLYVTNLQREREREREISKPIFRMAHVDIRDKNKLF